MGHATIEIRAENNTQQAFRQTEQSLKALEQQTREVTQASRQTMQAFERTQQGAANLGREFTGASRGAGVLTRSVSSLGNVLGALGIAAVTAEVFDFGKESINAAAQMEQLERGLQITTGSATAASQRMSELISVANFPGLQLTELVNFNNRLTAIGLSAEDIDKILLTTGQTIVAMGGNSHIAAEAVEQLTQAFSSGRVTMQDFRSIAQRIPGFYQAIADVHDVSANIEGLREAVDNAGGSMRDTLIPVMDELARRFEAPPSDSYIVAMDTLDNAFTLLQASIGSLFLPAIADAAFALAEFFESVRAGINDVEQLPKPIRDIIEGGRDLYEGLLNIAESIESSVGPEIRALIPTLATLLGSVLDLAGSISQLLAPAYELWNQVNAVVVGLINKLAQDITGIIDVLTGFVDWVASAWQEEDRFTESTQRVTKAIEEVEAAATDASGTFQEYAGSLQVLLTELQSVNAELEQKKARLKELEEEGLGPTDASMAQIVRRIGLLEERSKSLTESLPDLKQTLEDVNAQLEQKRSRLAEIPQSSDAATASAEQLQRQITTLESTAALLNAQIAVTNETLTETPSSINEATEAVENYSLTLARLKARAEDARETLSDTIDFQQLSANYQAAIAESDAYYTTDKSRTPKQHLAKEKENTDEYRKIETDLFELRREKEQARKKVD